MRKRLGTSYPVYVFDIDGTIADCTHRLHHIKTKPKNWKEFFATMSEDLPIIPMIDMMERLEVGAVIIFCTGRPEAHREVTLEWLKTHVVFESEITTHDLYMRGHGDHRPDYTAKADLADKIIHDFGEIALWFDDRQGVVDALRAKGIKVLQVAANE
jgi:phosphoglycolate phosphatase-like HAD superfamily hydrolase